jgi:hypothetical protein
VSQNQSDAFGFELSQPCTADMTEKDDSEDGTDTKDMDYDPNTSFSDYAADDLQENLEFDESLQSLNIT